MSLLRILILFLVLLASAEPKRSGSILCYQPSTKAPQEMPEHQPASVDERHCQKDTECTFIVGVCGHCNLAVNLKSLEAVKQRVAGKNAAVNCLFGTPPNPEVKCIRHSCVVSELP